MVTDENVSKYEEQISLVHARNLEGILLKIVGLLVSRELISW